MGKNRIKISSLMFFLFCSGVFLLSVFCGAEALEPVHPPEQAPVIKDSAQEEDFQERPEENLSEGTYRENFSDLTPCYDPKGRIDPFFPIFDMPVAGKGNEKNGTEAHTPLTALERIDLGQLKLVGIVASSLGPSAVVEEASGRAHVVKLGTGMGVNSGKVTEIGKDHILVMESVILGPGEILEEKRELKLLKPTEEKD